MLQLTVNSCKKAAQMTNTVNTSSPGIQIISPYMYNGSVTKAPGSSVQVFNFKNINQVPIAAHATTNIKHGLENLISPCKQISSMVPNVSKTNSSGSSGTIALALKNNLMNRRAGKQQRKLNDIMIKQFMKSISSASHPSQPSQPSPSKEQQILSTPKTQQEIVVNIKNLTNTEKSFDDCTPGKSQLKTASKQVSRQSSNETHLISESDKCKVEGIKVDLARKISGQKRGRKSRTISDYCEHTEQRIKELKVQLEDPETCETQKPKIRNQISAFQARMKAKI